MHRDIKPGNLLMSTDGFVKIGDFGLATSLDESRAAVEGTKRYIAPELLLQEREDGEDSTLHSTSRQSKGEGQRERGGKGWEGRLGLCVGH